MFTRLKAALARILGVGEDEAHALVTAVEADVAPMLANFRQQLTADLTAAVAEAKVDADKLAEDIAARVLAALGKTTAAPSEPTTT